MNEPPAASSASPATQASAHCPECGAQVAASDAVCWLCHRQLIITAEAVGERTPAILVPARPRGQTAGHPLQFSIETLLLVTTLIAVCLGLSLSAPGLGIPLAMVAVPALVRTLIAGHQERAVGGKLSLAEKVLTFLASTGIMIAVLAAGGAAFFATCSVALFGGLAIGEATNVQPIFRSAETWIWGLILLSSVVGLATAGWIFWITRPRRRDPY
jgi:hypothetical protein